MIFGIFCFFRVFTCLERVGNDPDVTVRTKNLRGLGILFLQKKSFSEIFTKYLSFFGPNPNGYWESQQVIFGEI